MKNTLSLVLISFTFLFCNGQDALPTLNILPSTPETASFATNTNYESSFKDMTLYCSVKFDAVISVIEYGDSNPVRILYKVYPHGGSGNYKYRWRVYGNVFEGNGTDTFELNFPCLSEGEEQISKVYCEVTDLDTNKKFLAELRYPVIPCYTINN